MTLPIIWNQALQRWEVQDESGRVLWRGINYADAAQFADDYLRQKAVANGLTVGSVRG